MFSRRFSASVSPLAISERDRIMLLFGGSGELGHAILAEKPANTIVVSVSKRRAVSGESVISCHFDLAREPERAFRHLAALLPFVDTLVYAAYAPLYASVEDIERAPFLAEYELNVYTAMHSLRLCAKTFWEGKQGENRARNRKALLISSAAAFGKTSRPELASYSATKAALNALGPYAHDYLFERCGVPLAILAPGSLREPGTHDAFVKRFWDLSVAPQSTFSIERIV